jgi:hypothetical protein
LVLALCGAWGSNYIVVVVETKKVKAINQSTSAKGKVTGKGRREREREEKSDCCCFFSRKKKQAATTTRRILILWHNSAVAVAEGWLLLLPIQLR